MKPSRSVLSVPGHMDKMQKKAAAGAADVIMLDLEDSVPADKKLIARQIITKAILTGDWKGKTLAVRINPLDTPFAYEDIIQVVEAAGQAIDFIVIPKVAHAGDIHFLARLLNGIEMRKKIYSKIAIEASIETAAGLEQVTSIAQADQRLRSLSFGVADYTTSIGAKLVSLSGHGENEEEIYPGHRWHYPISRIVMAAKANGLLAIDAPFGNFKAPKALESAAAMAAALGCDGKWVIHPDQIEIVNKVFSPTPEEIRRAKQILDAVKTAGSSSQGATAINGQMIDLATARLAEKVWDQARQLGLVEK
ncbi:MAG: CoA ester lyase [Desulfobacteraceae bacterium]|nr:CoA ester lyase [Desulfobacteraceae bacterium]